MFSNRSLAIIAAALLIGAATDGVLYNLPDTATTIYPLDDARSIEVKHQDNVVLALQKAEHEWVVSAPFHAPAKASRVALLLDTNHQTARSYNAEDLQTAIGYQSESFPDPIELRIDNNLFLLGNIEPVSQLRYVSANDTVYLQADHVLPLLQSPKSTFTNLTIARSVESVELEIHLSDTGNTTAGNPHPSRHSPTPVSPEQLSRWSDLEALAVIDAQLLDQTPVATATVDQTAADKKRYDIIRFQKYIALYPSDAKYAYLVSEEQADKLGICVYC